MSLLLKKIIKVKNKKESLSKETGLALLYWGSLYNKSGHEFFFFFLGQIGLKQKTETGLNA